MSNKNEENIDFSGGDSNFTFNDSNFTFDDSNAAVNDSNFAVDGQNATPSPDFSGDTPDVVPNMFAENDNIKTVDLVKEKKPTESNQAKKKKSKLPLIIIALLLVVALAVAAVFLAPLLFLNMGDSEIAAENYGAASDYYDLTFGMYDSENRVLATQAILVAQSGNIEGGITTALDNGIEVQVDYDLNGGRFINDSRQAQVLLDEPEDFAALYKATKDYYSFEGWEVSDISYAPDFDDDHVELSLKAKFEVAKYEIAYTNLYSDTNDGNPVEYTYETSTITLKNPSRVGYTFDGWSGTDINGTTGTVVIPQGSSGDRSYIANWTPHKYTVTFNPDVECDIESQMTVTYDDAFLMPAIEKRGYTYRGWSDGTNTFVDGLWSLTTDVSVAPVWELNTYTLKYDLGGGQVATPNAASYTVLDEEIAITDPTRFGYTFLGWTYEGQTTAKKAVVIPAHSVGNFNFVANWIGNPHKITLDLAGGTASSSVVNVRFGSQYTVPTPTRVGYTFQGWYNGNSKQATSGTWNQDNDFHLVAKWKANEYTITYDLAGGTASNFKKSVTVVFDNNVTLPIPTRYGYTFKGWYQWSTVYQSGIWKTPNNVNLTAVWKANTHTIKLNTNGGKVSPASVTVTFDQAYTLPNATRTGYTFKGWYDGSKKYTGGTWTQDNGITLGAQWENNKYTVTLSANGGSLSSSSKQTVTFDKSYSFGAPTRTGYNFVGWYSGSTIIPTSGTYTWPNDLYLTAKWEGKEYTITFDANGGKVTPSRKTVVYGDSYKLPTPLRTGYDFEGWYYYSTKIPTKGTWERDADITVEAKWELIRCDVELDANGGYVSRDSYTISYGDSYSLPTPTREGYVFLGWYDGSKKVASYGTWEYEDHDMELEAKWEAMECKITLDANGGICSKSSYTATYGEKYSLPTPVLDGYQFLGWYRGSTKVDSSGKWDYTVETMTLTAKWQYVGSPVQ